MKPPLNLFLATSTACNVSCKTCPVGRKERQPGGVMSLEMLDKILKKATTEARLLSVQLYHYNEPLLIPHIAEMIKLVKSYGVKAYLSSNLSMSSDKIVKAIEAKPDWLLISVSGWTQSIYERSHKGGNIQTVRDNMLVVKANRPEDMYVQVSWHRYKYNEHELILMQDYAESLGFKFVPYITSLLPHTRAVKVWETGIEDPSGEDILYPVMAAKDKCYERRGWDCLIQDQVITVNSIGDYLNCSNRSDPLNQRGSFFDISIIDLLKKRKLDADCIKCKSVGAHVYSTQEYRRSLYSPARLAEAWYRKMGLQGTLPALSHFATKHFYSFMRPQEKETL